MNPPKGMIPMANSKKGVGYYDPSTGQTRYDQKTKYRKSTPKGVAETQKADNARDGGSPTSDPGGEGQPPRPAPRGHQREVHHLEQTHRVTIGHYTYTKHDRNGHVGWVEALHGKPTGHILSSAQVLAFFHRFEGDPHQEKVEDVLRQHQQERDKDQSERDKQLMGMIQGFQKGRTKKPRPPRQPPVSGRTLAQIEQAPEIQIGPVVYHRHDHDGVVSWVGYQHGVRTGKVHDSQWVLDHWNWAHAQGARR